MSRLFSALVVLAFAVPLFAHGGHAHMYMGTVTMLHDNSFMMKTNEGKQVTVDYTEKTAFAHSDNHPANESELAVGTRVVVKMSTDGKTATSVKMSAPAKTSDKKN
jgi:hypothetical protein